MKLRPPDDQELRQLAAASSIELSGSELEQFQSLLPKLFAVIEQLEEIPLPQPPSAVAERQVGSRPPAGDDPLNAIVRRCSVKAGRSGKLAGKRVGLKDNVCVAGIPMTCGSTLLEGYVPNVDATIVTRLLEAGAEIVAMLNMDSFSLGLAGESSAYGPTRNPHNLEHLAGGSSSGPAAALYYDDIDMTIGGDQGGSIRVPASWSGVVGLKPTFGLVPCTGVVGLDPSVDHVGPMARTVADVALLLEVIAGKDPLDPRQGEVPVQSYTLRLQADIRGIRIGALREGFGWTTAEADVEPAVRRAIEMLRGLGADVREVSVPGHREAGSIVWALVGQGMAALFRGSGLGYHWKGFYNEHLAVALAARRLRLSEGISPLFKLLLIGGHLSHHSHGLVYAKAQNRRRVLAAGYDRVFQDVDVLAMPTAIMKATRWEPHASFADLVTRAAELLGNTAPFNLTGHPSLSVPCGTSNGLPIGLMLTGRHFEEPTLLRVAHAFEAMFRASGMAGSNWPGAAD